MKQTWKVTVTLCHAQGKLAAGSCVVFIDDRPAGHMCIEKNNIKIVDGVDDYAECWDVELRRQWRQQNRGQTFNYDDGDEDDIDIDIDDDDDDDDGGVLLVDSVDPWLMPDLVVIDQVLHWRVWKKLVYFHILFTLTIPVWVKLQLQSMKQWDKEVQVVTWTRWQQQLWQYTGTIGEIHIFNLYLV